MKKLISAAAICLAVTFGSAGAAGPILVGGQPLNSANDALVYQNTTYVSVRAVAEALEPEAQVAWTGAGARVQADGLELTAKPGTPYIESNDRALYVQNGVLLDSGRTMAPIRVLADAMGADVEWDPATGAVTVTRSGPATTGSYCSDELYWLSRIISAESRGESLNGKIAVGNVILNRVKSSQFPNSIYDVIFDSRWGGQFTPVKNGTIYQDPTDESVLAAKLVLEGANVAGNSLYFFAPSLTQDRWIMQNRPYVTTIGTHYFYA